MSESGIRMSSGKGRGIIEWDHQQKQAGREEIPDLHPGWPRDYITVREMKRKQQERLTGTTWEMGGILEATGEGKNGHSCPSCRLLMTVTLAVTVGQWGQKKEWE